MKLLWLHIVEFYLKIGFKFYFKKIEAEYHENIPKDKTILFLSNHQNALLDPLLITTKSTRKNYFLTRAAVFKNPRVAKILNSLQMLPIYRMIDGVDIIKKNKAIFTYCTKLLHKKKSIVLFPEGSHSLKRRVRPLKKGVTRIIEETLKNYPKTEIIIIPIGLNYQNPLVYGDSVKIIFGNHISPNKYWKDDTLDFNGLLKVISSELKKLTTTIESIPEYDSSLKKLTALQVDFTNPIEVNKCLKNDFNYTGNKVKKDSSVFKLLKFFIKFFYFLPYFIWKKVTLPKIEDEEFIGTFRYAIIITVAPIYLFLGLLLFSLLFGKTIGLIFLSIGILLPLLTLRTK